MKATLIALFGLFLWVGSVALSIYLVWLLVACALKYLNG